MRVGLRPKLLRRRTIPFWDRAPSCALASGQSFCGVARSHSGIALLAILPQPAGAGPNSAPRRRFSSLLGPQNQRRNCPMMESQCSYNSHAAKRGVGFYPHGGWQCTDEAVKEPAVQGQFRIRRRHLECTSTASITKYLSALNPCIHPQLPTTRVTHWVIRGDEQERFGLAELQSILPSGCG